MINNIPKSIKTADSAIIANEVLKRGIKINHINDYQEEMAFLELSYKKHFEYIISRKSSMISSTADYAVKNKALTKSLLLRAKISVPSGRLFYKDNINGIYEYANKIKYPVVIKKNDGSLSKLVFVGIKNKKECAEAVRKILKENDYVLVEKEFIGEELRFIVIKNKVFAITYRDPANVIGDGIHSIKELVEIKNKDFLRGEEIKIGTYLIKIKIDNVVKSNLRKNSLNLSAIISKGRKVYLRENSEKHSVISTGGDNIDVTDVVHPELKKIAVKAARAIPGLAYAGVDLITNKNISQKPTKSGYAIIELNSNPAIYPQHFPYQGKPRNVAKEIIDILFPETKGKYIK